MSGAIFLSAGVPDARRSAEYAATADIVAITAAVSSLVHVTLGRRLLVWGGHPAITPMISIVANEIGVDYGSWVKLYQSSFFEDEFPEDNKEFGNVIFTKNLGDRNLSLQHMRERMLEENEFDGAVFVGGMEGIVDEYRLFQKIHPKSVTIPIGSAGGAAQVIAREVKQPDFLFNLDYINLYHRYLNISVRELRYAARTEQPPDIKQRFWRD